jgi:hypothetical protein
MSGGRARCRAPRGATRGAHGARGEYFFAVSTSTTKINGQGVDGRVCQARARFNDCGMEIQALASAESMGPRGVETAGRRRTGGRRSRRAVRLTEDASAAKPALAPRSPVPRPPLLCSALPLPAQSPSFSHRYHQRPLRKRGQPHRHPRPRQHRRSR